MATRDKKMPFPADPSYLRRGTSAYRRANWALFIAGFVIFSTLYDFQPLLPLLSRKFGVTPAMGSLALSVSTFAVAWTLPISGTISDALGRRGMIAIMVVVTSTFALATAFAGGFPALIALRLIQGVAIAGVPAVAMTYLNEEIEPRSLGTAMGLYIAGNAIGGMSGRFITAGLVDFLPWRTVVALIGAGCLALSFLILMLLPPSRHFHRRPFRLGPLTRSLVGHLRDPGLLCLFVVGFSCLGGFVTLYNYVIFRLLDPPYSLGTSQVAWIFLSYAFGAFGSSFMGALVDPLGRSRILFTSLTIMTSGLLLTLFTSLPAVLCGVVVFTIGFFGAHSVASAWVGVRASTAKAQASSLYLFSYYMGSSISGTGGGFFWSTWGWEGVAVLIAALLGLALLAALGLVLLPARPGETSAAGSETGDKGGCPSETGAVGEFRDVIKEFG
jgi:YNFM family putative membrane transporter